MLPHFAHKDVLDLGCGFGWHCRYVREQDANEVVGVDISRTMLDCATEMTSDDKITYLHVPMEEIEIPDNRFDVVISSLALHYVRSFSTVCHKIHNLLTSDGSFVFSVEHPIFTSRQEQAWHINNDGERVHRPVDHYQKEGIRNTTFLSEQVTKYH